MTILKCGDAPLGVIYFFQIPSEYPGSACIPLSVSSGQTSWRRSLSWFSWSWSHVLLVRRCQEEHGKELTLQRAQQEAVGMEKSNNGKGNGLIYGWATSQAHSPTTMSSGGTNGIFPKFISPHSYMDRFQHLLTMLKQHFVNCLSWFYGKFCHGNVHHRWPQVTTANKTLPPLESHPSPSSQTSDPASNNSCKQTLGAQATSNDPLVGEATLRRMHQLHLSHLSFHSWKIRGRDLNVSKWKKIPTYKILWKRLQIKSSIEAVKPPRAESTAPSLGRGSSAHLFGWWKQRDLKIALLR